MNQLLFEITTPTFVTRPYGLVQLDFDTNAERVIILDRTSCDKIYHRFVPKAPVLKILVPVHYTISNTLMIGIIDDSGEYNCSFLDGVKAELVDANTVSLI